MAIETTNVNRAFFLSSYVDHYNFQLRGHDVLCLERFFHVAIHHCSSYPQGTEKEGIHVMIIYHVL